MWVGPLRFVSCLLEFALWILLVFYAYPKLKKKRRVISDNRDFSTCIYG